MTDLLVRFRKYVEKEQELPRMFRRDPEEKEKRKEEWDTLKQVALEAEGGRIWRKPIHQH